MLSRALLLLAGWHPVSAWTAQVPVPARQEELVALAARDQRLAFTMEASRRARAALEGEPDDVETRAVAVLALGAGRSLADLPRLDSVLGGGALPERRAAILAVGQMGPDGVPLLERALERDTSGVAEALCLALAMAEQLGAPRAGERLQNLCAGDGALARRARAARASLSGEVAEEFADTLRLYYELRWRAARTYGFIDGLRGRDFILAELLADEEFLDRVVLAAAVVLEPTTVEPHLRELLAAGHAAALPVFALHEPGTLAHAYEEGDWQPSPEDWSAILGAIEARRAEAATLPLLEIAFHESDEFEARAGLLLFRAGAELPWTWFEEQFERGDAARRSALIEACGARGEARLIPELSQFHPRAKELGVESELLVALARLAHPPARAALTDQLAQPAGEERARLIGALARGLESRDLRAVAERALSAPDLGTSERLALEVALANIGALFDRSGLREALPRARNPARRLAAVRALAHAPEPADLEVLAALFPVTDDLEVNVELALALLAERHASSQVLLRAALWNRAWNRSVLAGGLIVARAGVRGLMDELALAPRSAGESDLRRVGFALGEWGGLGAVEELARTRAEGDAALQGALLGALSARAGEPEPFRLSGAGIHLEFPRASGGLVPGGSRPAATKGAKKPKKGKKKKLF